ncbi:MAG: hypothetical protein Tsb009_28910 [Planctomycetaceae bacterium]
MKTALVITFDRLRLHDCGCYGNTAGLTPALDRFACDAVVFDCCYAENTQEHAVGHAWWSGRYQFLKSPDEQQTERDVLAETLRTQNIESSLIGESSAESVVPFPMSFGTTLTIPEADDTPQNASATFEKILEAAFRVWRHQRESNVERNLLWLKLNGQSDHANSGENRTQQMRDIDGMLGTLLNTVQSELREEDGLFIVITAGQGAPPDGSRLPANFQLLGEEVAHVPLLMFATDGEAGIRSSELVQAVDLFPTLLDWFGCLPETDANCEGCSLLPIVRGEVEKLCKDGERDILCLGDGRRAMAIRTREDYTFAMPEAVDNAPEPWEASEDSSSVMRFLKPDDVFEVMDVASHDLETTTERLLQLKKFVGEREN